MNPATKQYLTLSIVISIIFSFIINFAFVDLAKGSFLYGFPISINEVEGFLNFLFRLLNTAIIAAFLVFPVLLLLRELDRRR